MVRRGKLRRKRAWRQGRIDRTAADALAARLDEYDRPRVHDYNWVRGGDSDYWGNTVWTINTSGVWKKL